MKIEISAGGAVIKKIDNQTHVLLLKDKKNQWTLPKGLIEEGEPMEETAKREIKEEVGLTKIKLLTKLKPIQYFYKFESELIKKTVHYFLFEELEEETLQPQKEEGINEVKWAPIDEAMNIVGYQKTNRKVLEEAREFLIRQRRM